MVSRYLPAWEPQEKWMPARCALEIFPKPGSVPWQNLSASGLGVAVFTNAGGGLMAEASIGGQKFTYEAF